VRPKPSIVSVVYRWSVSVVYRWSHLAVRHFRSSNSYTSASWPKG